MTFLVAGHETTGNALSWAVYLLSQHPREAAALRSELGAVLGDRPAASLAFDDLAHLPYLDAVCHVRLGGWLGGWVGGWVRALLGRVMLGVGLLGGWKVGVEARGGGGGGLVGPV
jgi:hypothetical protein